MAVRLPRSIVETAGIMSNKKSDSWSLHMTITMMHSFSCVVKWFPTIFS